jgi:hypothetical protein
MTWTTSARFARLATRTRFILLALVSLFLGHEAVYAAEHGIGAGFASAMTELGHGVYWAPFMTAAAAAAIALSVSSALMLGRLHVRLAGTPRGDVPGAKPVAPGVYRRELAAIWPRLAIVVVGLFVVQENLESFVARGAVPGVDVLFGGGLPQAVPVLALVTFALAAVGALVRWRIRILAARLHALRLPPRTSLRASTPAREWAGIDAAAPHRWILDRRDAGRAPPPGLHPVHLATA